MGPCYTVAELLALRSQGLPTPHGAVSSSDSRVRSYLAIFNRYVTMTREGPGRPGREPVQTVLKYDYALSNKEFKKRWVKTHGTSAGLKNQPRVPVKVRSIRVQFLERFFRSLERTEQLLRKLFRRISVRPSKLPKAPSKPLFSGKVESAPVVRPNKRERLAIKLQRTAEGNFFRVIGGTTTAYDPQKPPPKAEWKKYWYFFRKKGFWKPSEHHPYGDEFVGPKDHVADRSRPG